MSVSILVAVDDLFFQSKILATAAVAGIPATVAASRESVIAQAEAFPPALIILDLHSARFPALDLLRALKSHPTLRTTPVLGYFSHVQRNVGAAATEAGCDIVLPRSAFSEKLPDLLKQYAAPPAKE